MIFASVVQTVQVLMQDLTSKFVILCWCKSCMHIAKKHTLDFAFQSLPGLAVINRILIFSCATWQRQKAVVRSQAFDGEGKLLILDLGSVPSYRAWPGIIDEFQLRVFPIKTCELSQVAHPFNPSTQEQRQAHLCELEASLAYKVSPGQPGLITQRNPASKKKKKEGQGLAQSQVRRHAHVQLGLV